MSIYTNSAASDVNGDGRSDIIWWNVGARYMSVWLSDPNYSTIKFIPNALTFGSPSGFNSIFYNFDLNGDGKSDLYTQLDNTHVGVYTSKGTDFFGNPFIVDGYPRYGDFNGDGLMDLIYGSTNSIPDSRVSFFDGQNFGPQQPANLGSTYVDAFGDFNGDGKTDVILREFGEYYSNEIKTITVRQSTSNSIAAFADPVFVDNTVSAQWLISGVADFTGDGRDDLLFRNRSDGTVSVWQSTGDGFNKNTYVMPTDTSFELNQVGDFNGDGKADLLWYRRQSGLYTTWESNGDGFDQNTSTWYIKDHNNWSTIPSAPL